MSSHEMMALALCLADRKHSLNILIIIYISICYSQYIIYSQLYVTVISALGQIFLVLSPSKHMIIVLVPLGVEKAM